MSVRVPPFSGSHQCKNNRIAFDAGTSTREPRGNDTADRDAVLSLNGTRISSSLRSMRAASNAGFDAWPFGQKMRTGAFFIRVGNSARSVINTGVVYALMFDVNASITRSR